MAATRSKIYDNGKELFQIEFVAEGKTLNNSVLLSDYENKSHFLASTFHYFNNPIFIVRTGPLLSKRALGFPSLLIEPHYLMREIGSFKL